MTISEQVRRRRHSELAECWAVVDTCLACYYGGAKHMYRPLAGQLRILFCDRTSRPLLGRVFPDLKIGALRQIEWSVPDQTRLFDDTKAQLTVQHPPDQEFRLARMPFLITEYENGLQSADFEFDEKGQLLALDDWLDQIVTVYPSALSLREVIKSIAERGGGAHVDDKPNKALKHMAVTGPTTVGVHVLFTIALGRFAQRIGLHYTQFVERSGYHGKLEDIIFDPRHPTVGAAARVPRELETGPRKQFALTVLKRIR